MELTPEIYELIEQYLNGELQGVALQNFEKRLATDEALTKEVAFQREMHSLLAETPENDLRKTLQMLSDQVVEPKETKDKGWLWWLWPAAGEANVLDWLLGNPTRHLAWVLPLLLVAGWWLLNRNDFDVIDPPIVATDTLEYDKRIEKVDTSELIAVDPLPPLEDTLQEEPIKPNSIIPKGTMEKDPTPVVKQELKTKPTKARIKEVLPHLQSDPQKEKGPDPIYPKIDDRVMASLPPSADSPPKTYELSTPPVIYWDAAYADVRAEYFDADIYFSPSTKLDSLVSVTRQTGAYKIELVEKPEVIYLAKNIHWSDTLTQKAPIKLVIETDKDLFQQELVLYVIDNQGNPYGPFPLLESIQFDGADKYIIQTQIPLWDNTPRLVYYTIEDYKTKISYFADKMVVLPKDSLFDIKDFPFKGTIIQLLSESNRQFVGAVPDFFEPNTLLEAAIKDNQQLVDFEVNIQPVIPDTIRIDESLLEYDTTLSAAMLAARQAYIDSIFTFQLMVNTTENVLKEGLTYRIVDNVDSVVTQNHDDGYGIKKKYGKNEYFLDFKIGYSSDYPEGLYYYQIYAGDKTFTGKYIIITNKD